MPLRQLTAAIALLAAAAPVAPAAPVLREPGEPDRRQLAVHELVIRLAPAPGIDQRPQWVRVDVPAGEEVTAAARRLGATPGVVDVAYNYRYRLHGDPDDEFYDLQWNLPEVGWPGVWERYDGSGVVVAVLDSGVSQGGVDLDCHIWVHPYNAADGSADVSDHDGHGTHVAGTIAQCTDNGYGVAGIAPGASVMPIKVIDDLGEIDSLAVADGIAWAIDHGADVVNMSLGRDCGGCPDPVIDPQITAAVDAGLVVVGSAGNAGLGTVGSPANHPAAIAVGATTVGMTETSYSNYGNALDLMAPGGTEDDPIYQETFNCPVGGFVICGFSGTSMSAAHVSGAAAVLLSVVPVATPAEIRSVLTSSALDLAEPGWDPKTGYGLLQIDAAVDALLALPGYADPCPAAAGCDTVFLVDGAGLWRRWERLVAGSPVHSFYFGDPGDVAFSGDWDCDGDVTPGLYRQSDGFVYLRNSSTQGIADIEFFFGNPGDVPVAGDFDGDGCDTVGVYRPAEGRFFVIDELGADGGGLGAASHSYYFGDPGDKPFAGDFDGDGVDTLGLHRESTGLVYFRDSHTTGIADVQFVYGDPGDVVLAADWDGDGDDTVAVYRPGDGRLYVRLANGAGNADVDLSVGLADQAARSQA